MEQLQREEEHQKDFQNYAAEWELEWVEILGSDAVAKVIEPMCGD